MKPKKEIKIDVPFAIYDMMTNCTMINGLVSCKECHHNSTCKEYRLASGLKKLVNEYNGIKGDD